MIRSMFTAISSLRVHQYYMDTVADNLSNANTTAFKAGRFSFRDQFAQTMSVGATPSETLGGINPTQIGLGTQLGSIARNFTQGSLQSTGSNTDLAIQGDGFFVYTSGSLSFYSRDGMLDMDAQGYLVHASTGMRLQGWQAVSGSVNTGEPISAIQLPLGSTLARATSNATLTGNLDASAGSAGTYNMTMGVYDSLGVLHSVMLTFTRGSGNDWTWSASGSGASGTGTVTFDNYGQFQSVSGTTITVPGSSTIGNFTVEVDFTRMTQLATASDAAMSGQDGLSAGALTTFYVSSNDGKVYGLYSNGMQQLVGQLGIAKFINPIGLERVGQNMYRSSLNSGDPNVGVANTGGRGVIASGYLESSNVDMAQEFTNMILAQRGFQASSRVITTSDEMLQELVNLKR